MMHGLSQKINELYAENDLMKDFNGYILIREGHDILFQQSFGYSNYETKQTADENTLFNLASITKQFTAMSVLQLDQKGLLSIDASIGSYLPDFIPGAHTKIRDMLNMVSGMPEYWWRPGWEETSDKTSQDSYKFIKTLTDYYPPRQKFEYCNSNYIVLGKLIEKVSGIALEEYMKQNIFRPLGMEQSCFLSASDHVPNHAVGYRSPRIAKWEKADMFYSFAGAAGLSSTATDLCRWDAALYTEELLDKEHLGEMFRPVLSNYAMGWYVNEANVSHGGDAPGFSTRITRYPERKLLILLLCNCDGCKESNMGHYASLIEKCILT